MKRILKVDVCDYSGALLCNLYDSEHDLSGGAFNVFGVTERNGWKELNFSIPSVCYTDEMEEERNYRIDYLKGDYLLRTIDDYETDYYLISEPKITHNDEEHLWEVRAGHNSQILKYKNLDLEFSAEEGNNVGTAEMLLDTILEGSSWSRGEVYEFKEKNSDEIKQRTLVASANTGVLGLIEKLCDLFEAKPIYHGYTRTVDILPMNPFEEVDAGEIPEEILESGNVFELHYDKNVHNLSKVQNTDNISTRLYAYGSYGDQNGTVTIQKCQHIEYTFTVTEDIVNQRDEETGALIQEFTFEDEYGTDYFFKATDLAVGNTLVWSQLDITSKSYIWNNRRTKAYKLTKVPTGSYLPLPEPEVSVVENKFPFLLSLKYYDEAGILTDTMFQTTAKFQRDLPGYYTNAENAAAEMIELENQLSETAQSNTGFLKLDVLQIDRDPGEFEEEAEGYSKLIIKKSTTYPDGVIYRTDYDEAERKFFQWHVAKKLRADGEPTSGIGSLIYIVHNTNPITWDKAYLRYIYNDDGDIYLNSNGEAGDFVYSYDSRPGAITVWAKGLSFSSSDKFYLFATNSMSGMLGAKTAEDEASVENLFNTTEKHQVYFQIEGTLDPDIDAVANTYGWYYKWYKSADKVGDLYFCWGAKGDTNWKRVYITENGIKPSVYNGAYYFDARGKVLYHGESNSWVKYETAADLRVASMFTRVYYYCRRRDMLYKGLYEYYQTTVSELPVGNYAFKTDYAFYYTFTTDQKNTGIIKLDTKEGHVYQELDDPDTLVVASAVPYDTVTYPSSNEFEQNMVLTSGTLNLFTGVEEDSIRRFETPNIAVEEGSTYKYRLPAESYCLLCNSGGAATDRVFLTEDNWKEDSIIIPENIRYVRINVPTVSLNNTYFYKMNEETEQAEGAEPKGENLLVKTTEVSTGQYRTGLITARENTIYEYCAPPGTSCIAYDINQTYLNTYVLSEANGNRTGTFTTPAKTKYIRIVSSVASFTSYYYLRVANYANKFYYKDEVYTVFASVSASGERLGINNLISKFATLADNCYGVQLKALQNAQNVIKDRNLELANVLGDLLRDGRWQDSNYVEGDADRLYADSMDMLKEISMPETTYEFTFLDPYGSNEDLEFYEEEDVDWPDVLITDAAHLVDPEAGINCWAYIDKINKCYDKPWETTLEINTKLTLSSRHEFTDMLSRIAEVAKETKSKQQLYDRVEVFNADGSLPSAKLTGAIEIARNELDSGASNWSNDSKGNFILESADGLSAMILGGRGFGIASSKNLDGQWQWENCATGYGIVANSITTGYLAGERIEAGTITTTQLSANIGQMLDISSNKALNLFATVNGSRPAGALKTTDALIEIKAGKETVDPSDPNTPIINPAQINIISGGEINMKGGTINIASQGKLDISSTGEFAIRAKGADSLSAANDGIYIGTDGINLANKIYMDYSGNGGKSFVKMDASAIFLGTRESGTATAVDWVANTEYAVGDKVIYNNIVYRCVIANKDSWFNLTNPPKWVNETNWYSLKEAGTFIDGTYMEIDAARGALNIKGSSVINVAANKSLTLVSNGYVKIGNGNKPFTVGGNSTDAYIYYGMTNLDSMASGIYIGTDGLSIGGGKFKYSLSNNTLAVQGEIQSKTGLIGGWTIEDGRLSSGSSMSYVALDSKKSGTSSTSYVIWAGAENISDAPFRVQRSGTVYASNLNITGGSITISALETNSSGTQTSVKQFEVTSAGKVTAKNLNITGGTIAITDSTTNTVNFQVTNKGELTSKSGHIGGWTIAEGSLYSGSGSNHVKLDSSYTLYPLSGLSDTATSKTYYAIWCGKDAPNAAPFSVTKDGTVTISKLRVKTGEDAQGNGIFQTVDMQKWFDSDDQGTVYSMNYAMGKLKFQTIKSITKNSQTGQVTINYTDNNGGTQRTTFNTAGSVKISAPTWTGGTSYGYGWGTLSIQSKSGSVVTDTITVTFGEDSNGNNVVLSSSTWGSTKYTLAVPHIQDTYYQKCYDDMSAPIFTGETIGSTATSGWPHITATTTNSKTNDSKSTDKWLNLYQYTYTVVENGKNVSHNCVNLDLDGAVIGRITTQNIYNDGYSSGYNKGHTQGVADGVAKFSYAEVTLVGSQWDSENYPLYYLHNGKYNEVGTHLYYKGATYKTTYYKKTSS